MITFVTIIRLKLKDQVKILLKDQSVGVLVQLVTNNFSLRSPAMSGGIFAIDKEYFFEIGAYDPGMKIWGAENLEMSFRVSTGRRETFELEHQMLNI